MTAPLAHGGFGPHFLEELAAFGSDWLYVLVPLGLLLGVGALLGARSEHRGGPVTRLAHGAGRVTGLPAWSAGALAILAGSLIIAVVGFFWDVAWHIDIGRDEFLFSPPHVCLLVGLAGIGLAGLTGILTATRSGADVGWRAGRWRFPYGPTAMLIAGAAALVGFGVDELWHAFYGLDVTMWSPPHLTMISAAAFVGIAGWLTYAEGGGDRAARPAARRHLHGLLAGVLLIALSAWQLEYDLGVPQWQQLAQVVLIAVGGGFALTTARVALGRGGALLAVGHYLAVRILLYAVTAGAWSLSEPRFPLYLVSALVVEAVFDRAEGRRPVVQAAWAGVGIATLGLAGEWLVSQVWFHHPWQTRLLPWLPLAVVAAVAASVLGVAFGRIVSERPAGVPTAVVATGLVALLGSVALTLPKTVPDATATLRTAPAGDGAVQVEVTVDRPAVVAGADRWEVMAWQGDGRVLAPLTRTAEATWRTAESIPVTGDWKTNVMLANGSDVAAIPVRLPADPEIDAEEVPLEDERTAEFSALSEVLLREAHAGPAWPGLVAYAFVTLSMLAMLGTMLAGAVALHRTLPREAGGVGSGDHRRASDVAAHGAAPADGWHAPHREREVGHGRVVEAAGRGGSREHVRSRHAYRLTRPIKVHMLGGDLLSRHCAHVPGSRQTTAWAARCGAATCYTRWEFGLTKFWTFDGAGWILWGSLFPRGMRWPLRRRGAASPTL